MKNQTILFIGGGALAAYLAYRYFKQPKAAEQGNKPVGGGTGGGGGIVYPQSPLPIIPVVPAPTPPTPVVNVVYGKDVSTVNTGVGAKTDSTTQGKDTTVSDKVKNSGVGTNTTGTGTGTGSGSGGAGRGAGTENSPNGGTVVIPAAKSGLGTVGVDGSLDTILSFEGGGLKNSTHFFSQLWSDKPNNFDGYSLKSSMMNKNFSPRSKTR